MGDDKQYPTNDPFFGYTTAGNTDLVRERRMAGHMGELNEVTHYPPPPGGSADYTPSKDRNDSFEVIYKRVMAQDANQVDALAKQWERVVRVIENVFDSLTNAANGLRYGGDGTRAGEDAQGWQSDAADVFLARGPGATLKSLDDWRQAAHVNNTGLAALSAVIRKRQTEMGNLLTDYVKEYDRIVKFLYDEGGPVYYHKRLDQLTEDEKGSYVGIIRRHLAEEFDGKAQTLERSMAGDYWSVLLENLGGGSSTRSEGPSNAIHGDPSVFFPNPNVGNLPKIHPPVIHPPVIHPPVIEPPVTDPTQDLPTLPDGNHPTPPNVVLTPPVLPPVLPLPVVTPPVLPGVSSPTPGVVSAAVPGGLSAGAGGLLSKVPTGALADGVLRPGSQTTGATANSPPPMPQGKTRGAPAAPSGQRKDAQQTPPGTRSTTTEEPFAPPPASAPPVLRRPPVRRNDGTDEADRHTGAPPGRAGKPSIKDAGPPVLRAGRAAPRPEATAPGRKALPGAGSFDGLDLDPNLPVTPSVLGSATRTGPGGPAAPTVADQSSGGTLRAARRAPAGQVDQLTSRRKDHDEEKLAAIVALLHDEVPWTVKTPGGSVLDNTVDSGGPAETAPPPAIRVVHPT
jgi:hypothetical protein